MNKHYFLDYYNNLPEGHPDLIYGTIWLKQYASCRKIDNLNILLKDKTVKNSEELLLELKEEWKNQIVLCEELRKHRKTKNGIT